MGSASAIRDINVYVDGGSYLGVIQAFEPPKIAAKTEGVRTGGMLGEVSIDVGVEKLEATLTLARNESRLIRKFGTGALDGVRLRLVEAHKDGDGRVQSIETYLNGRFTELDFGSSEPGKKVEHKFKAELVTYRRVVDGGTDIQIDMLSGVFIVGGVDRNAEIREIISG